jgi:hypothetical protein
MSTYPTIITKQTAEMLACCVINEQTVLFQFSTFTAKPTESLTGNVQGIAGKTAGVRPRERKVRTTRTRLASLKKAKREFSSKQNQSEGLKYV